jgi:hypothetical protein
MTFDDVGAGGWFEGFLRFFAHFREASGEQARPAVAQDSAR